MKELRNTLSDIKMWASMHILVGLGVPLVLLFFFGCKEIKIEEEKAPLGPQVEASAIEAELQKSLEETSVHSVLKNQQVVFEFTQTIENGAPNPYLYVKQHVIELHDTKDYFSFTYNEITEDPYAEPGTKPIVKEVESPKYIPKPEGELLSLDEQGLSSLRDLTLFSESRAELFTSERPVVRVTYHELHVEKEIQAAPPLVSRAPDCRGIPDCQIRVTRIRFDEVSWYSDTEYEKHRYTLEISPDVPYLGKVISECLAGQVPYEKRTVYLRQCQTLLDFTFGTAPE